MTNEQLEAICKRAEKATIGPWLVNRREYGILAYEGEDFQIVPLNVTGVEITLSDPEENGNAKSDAEFIANAREDIPALLAEVEKHRKEIEELTSMVRWSARRLRPFHRDFILNDLFELTGVRYDEEDSE